MKTEKSTLGAASTTRSDLKERGVPEPNLGPGGADLNTDEEAK